MDFLKKNWDKLLTIAIGAIVGFYAGVFAVKSDITALRERAATMEAELANLKPIVVRVSENTQKLVALEKDQIYLRNQGDLSVQTNKLLDLRLEQERSKTISQLKDLLSEIKQ